MDSYSRFRIHTNVQISAWIRDVRQEHTYRASVAEWMQRPFLASPVRRSIFRHARKVERRARRSR